MHLKDTHTTLHVGQREMDDPVEPSRSRERLVEGRRTIGGRHNDHAGVVLESVHFSQKLIDGVHGFVVPSATVLPRLAQSVKLVNEQDARGVLPRLLEHVPDTGRPDPDKHLHEFGTSDGEEWHSGLPGDGLCQQSLSRPRGAHQQDARRRPRAQPQKSLRILEERYHFRDLRLDLVDACNVIKRDLRVPGRDGLELCTAKNFIPFLLAADPKRKLDEQKREPDRKDEPRQRMHDGQRRIVVGWLDVGAVLDQVIKQLWIVRQADLLGPGPTRSSRLCSDDHRPPVRGVPHALHSPLLDQIPELRVRHVLQFIRPPRRLQCHLLNLLVGGNGSGVGCARPTRVLDQLPTL
mmetsp:Transcript_6573/g.18201  ORF Transcript_6573/g.18201 Transcript_6573/m.18201 type:complete len:350 (+) Transcript_6573:1138-2187(+)